MYAEQLLQDNDNLREVAEIAMNAVLGLSNFENLNLTYEEKCSIPIFKKMRERMHDRQTLYFLLPAFPAKSPCPKKTSGILPDLGEVLALNNLNPMCRKISSVYEPGAEVIICSDGRIFSDVVMVSDEHIDEYSKEIETIIKEFEFQHLSLFAMDDLYQDLKGPELRDRLIWQYAKSLDEIRYLVVNDDDFRELFNGIHKFLMEDQMALKENSQLSKNQINKKTKNLTYELLRRSDAWSVLLSQYFKNGLRLSIHGYPLMHEKFGVKLVPSSMKLATPWHNVTVKSDGKFELMHLSKALAFGAQKEMYRGKYVYFEL